MCAKRRSGSARRWTGSTPKCWCMTTTWRLRRSPRSPLPAAPSARISLGARGSADADYSDIVASGARFDVAANRPKPADIAAIVFSSGTTGKPKGIMHSQKTMLEAAKGGQVVMGPITPDSATLLYMQPSFAAWPIIVLPFVAAKAKVCFGKTFTPAAFLEACQRERITKAPLVPTMWRMVFEAGPENYDLSALTLVSISGEAPAPSDVRQLYDRICRNICLRLSLRRGVHRIRRDGQYPRPDGARQDRLQRPAGGRRRRQDSRARRQLRRRSRHMARPARSRSPARRWRSATGRIRS